MTQIRATLIALAFGLVGAPALAGDMTISLPRLTFPADAAPVTQDCATVTVSGAAPTCSAAPLG